MSDLDRLVRRCQQGELAAFSELFRLQEARVYRLAAAILREPHDAEDAVQDTFLQVFKRIRDYRGESSFQTWLTAIAVNMCRDRLRRLKVRRTLSLDWLRGRASSTDVVETVARREERFTLWSLVDRLDDAHRLPVILHYREGLACDEVAQVLGICTRAVYARLNAARARLRAMLRAASNVHPSEGEANASKTRPDVSTS